MYQRLNRTWLSIALVLSITLLVSHLMALHGFWYWRYRWSDIPMHILGGAALGSFIFAFGTRRRTLQYFLALLTLFLLWKMFEYLIHDAIDQPYHWLENLKDLTTSCIGFSVPFIIGRKTSWH